MISHRVCRKDCGNGASLKLEALVLTSLTGLFDTRWRLVVSEMTSETPWPEAAELESACSNDKQEELIDLPLRALNIRTDVRGQMTPAMAQFVLKKGNAFCLLGKIGMESSSLKPITFRTRRIARVAEAFDAPSESPMPQLITPKLMADLIKTDWFRTNIGHLLAKRVLRTLATGEWSAPLRHVECETPNDVMAVDPPGNGSCGYLAMHNALQMSMSAETLEILSNAYAEDKTVRHVFRDHFKLEESLLDSLGDSYETSSLPRTHLGLPWASLAILGNFARIGGRKYVYFIRDSRGNVMTMDSGNVEEDTPVGVLLFDSSSSHIYNLYGGGMPRVYARDVPRLTNILKMKWTKIVDREEDIELFEDQITAAEGDAANEIWLKAFDAAELSDSHWTRTITRLNGRVISRSVEPNQTTLITKEMRQRLVVEPQVDKVAAAELVGLTIRDKQTNIEEMLQEVKDCSLARASEITLNTAAYICDRGMASVQQDKPATCTEIHTALMHTLAQPIQSLPMQAESTKNVLTLDLLAGLTDTPFFRSNFGKNLAKILIKDLAEPTHFFPLTDIKNRRAGQVHVVATPEVEKCPYAALLNATNVSMSPESLEILYNAYLEDAEARQLIAQSFGIPLLGDLTNEAYDFDLLRLSSLGLPVPSLNSLCKFVHALTARGFAVVRIQRGGSLSIEKFGLEDESELAGIVTCAYDARKVMNIYPGGVARVPASELQRQDLQKAIADNWSLIEYGSRRALPEKLRPWYRDLVDIKDAASWLLLGDGKGEESIKSRWGTIFRKEMGQ